MSEKLIIPQIEVLRKMRQELKGYMLSDEEVAALTDVINHFDSCTECIRENESG